MNIPSQLANIPQILASMGFGDIHIKYDPQTELLAIITIHSNKLGPAIGGCRCIEYPDFTNALQDALNLARNMSYKTAICKLAWGGAKAVLLKPKQINDRSAYYRAFGRFVNELNGRYVTSIDSGTKLTDLAIIAEETPYVTGLAEQYGDNRDPSLATALGVKYGIAASVKYKLNKDQLAGLTIAIQGVGHVGYHLCKLLKHEKVNLIVSDNDPQLAERCSHEFDAQIVAPAEILKVECDVFSPCALGGIINTNSIPNLKTKIIAGSANNQITDKGSEALLAHYNILYAPDFVISSGGVILATALYDNRPATDIDKQLMHLYEVLLTIYTRADSEKLPTATVAEHIAEERLRNFV